MKISEDKQYTRDGLGCPGLPVPRFGTGSVIRNFERDSNLRRRGHQISLWNTFRGIFPKCFSTGQVFRDNHVPCPSLQYTLYVSEVYVFRLRY